MTHPQNPSLVEWNDASVPAPEGVPVIAEYFPWNKPQAETSTHVVWWFNGEWRTYPSTDDIAYVNRWKPLPITPSAADRITELEAQVERLREKVEAAYIAGATAVHEFWTANPGEAPRGDPEFGEAASDYAADALTTKEDGHAG